MFYEDVSEFVWQTETVMERLWSSKWVKGLETITYTLSLLKDKLTQISKNAPGNQICN